MIRRQQRRTSRTAERLALRRGARVGVVPRTIDVLYVSPHADDVAFSAAGQIARDRAAGLRVAVMTLFEAKEGMAEFSDAARKEEDARFARLAGIEMVQAGFADAIVRKAAYRWTPMIFAPVGAAESALVASIRTALQRFVYARGCTRVVAPLGVGGHVDHLTVHAALRDRETAVFYEDRPYALVPGAVHARLVEACITLVGADPDHAPLPAEPGALEASFAALPHLRAFLATDAEQRRRSLAWIEQRHREPRAACAMEPMLPPRAARLEVHEIDPESAALARKAASAYASQGDLLPAELPSLERMYHPTPHGSR